LTFDFVHDQQYVIEANSIPYTMFWGGSDDVCEATRKEERGIIEECILSSSTGQLWFENCKAFGHNRLFFAQDLPLVKPVTVDVGGTKFHTSRETLCSRSSFFKKLIERADKALAREVEVRVLTPAPLLCCAVLHGQHPCFLLAGCLCRSGQQMVWRDPELHAHGQAAGGRLADQRRRP
jgi:hypothetical protein